MWQWKRPQNVPFINWLIHSLIHLLIDSLVDWWLIRWFLPSFLLHCSTLLSLIWTICNKKWWELPPMWPGFKSRRWRHMWVKFFAGSLLCSERFFSGYSGFPLSSKTSISKFQFDQESGRGRTTLWMCYLQIIIYLFTATLISFSLAKWGGD